MPDELTHDRGITAREKTAIKLAEDKGIELVQKNPEIADDYRKGMTCGRIAEKYNIQGLTPEIAVSAVRFALAVLLTDEEREEIRERFSKARGAEFGRITYEMGTGLFGMTDEDKKRAAKEGGASAVSMKAGIHALTREEKRSASERSRVIQKKKGTGIYGLTPEKRREIGMIYGVMGGKKGGAISKERGVGVHAMTHEELSRAGKKGGHQGGMIAGPKNYERGLGIHALTREQRAENGRKSIGAVLSAQGKIQWDSSGITEPETGLNETGYLLYLSGQEEFIHGKGRGGATGRPNYKKITAKLNEIFHSGQKVRTPGAVQSYKNRLPK